MSRLVFGFDVQGRLLSVEAAAGDPLGEIWVGIRRVSWLLRAERTPRKSWGCARGAWSQHHPPLPRRKEIAELGVRKW